MIADGNPAAVRGINKIGLQRRGFSEQDTRALRSAYKKLFLKKDGNLSELIADLDEDLKKNPQVATLLKFIADSERGVTR